MSRILLVWELGDNLGHVGGFIPLARELRRRGHEPILVLRDLSRVHTLLPALDIPVLQAPLWQGAGRVDQPLNYAEILLNYGFMHSDALCSMINAWRNLFILAAAELIIFDHAPTALLASRGLNVARALFGTGFYSPPRSSPFPAMRRWQQHDPIQLLRNEAQVLASANIALQHSNTQPMNKLSELFEVDEDFLCTLPEFDHYPGRKARYWGPRYAYGSGHRPVWPEGTGKRIFAYLDKNYVHLDLLLQALAASASRVLIYAPGLSVQHTYANLTFLADSVDFDKLDCDVGICHAGHGTTSALLLCGIPLLLLPGQLEQYLLALNIQEMGAGLLVNPETQGKNYQIPLNRLLTEDGFTQRAQQFAARYVHQSPQQRMNNIVDRCEELLVR